MVAGGSEFILGAKRDALGTVVLLGAGGVMAEIYEDTALRVLPAGGGLTAAEALAMARDLKAWPLLDGYRGRPQADVEALARTVVAFSHLAAALGGRLVEAEINPLFVLADGKGVHAADGVVILTDF